MRILVVGDIVGKTGRKMVKNHIRALVRDESVDLVVANGENAAGGFGLTASVYAEIMACGVDFMTLGNHTWDKREILDFIDEEPRLVRPANFPPGTPGRGFLRTEVAGHSLLLINLMGRVFSGALLDCPFRLVDELVEREPADIVLVDMHAEATSEKTAMGYYLDGRATAVWGTHTHVQTADERLLPKGTAFITDVGMTGPQHSIIGMDPQLVLERMLTQRPNRFEVARGPGQLNGILIDADGPRATGIKRVVIHEQDGG